MFEIMKKNEQKIQHQENCLNAFLFFNYIVELQLETLHILCFFNNMQ